MLPPTNTVPTPVNTVIRKRPSAPSAIRTPRTRYQVGVVRWNPTDELAEVLANALETLGHATIPFDSTAQLPANIDIVFSFAPYGNFMALVDRLAALPAGRRPLLIHWNTEGIPDPHLPWPLIYPASRLRSWFGRTVTRAGVENAPPFGWFKERMLRYRYVGDYYSAYRRGLLTIFADSSAIYAQIHRKHGLPATYLPWGSAPEWYEDMHLPRDIDVLWLGKRGTKRRSQLLDQLRAALAAHGVQIYVIDNQENSYVFGRKRTEMLNRAKITLNITRTWFDDNFSRFSMAAPNRSLIVSEPMLPHCLEYKPGVHYVSTPLDELSATILHYLEAEQERRKIVENAYSLLTTELTMVNSVAKVLNQADAVLHGEALSVGNHGA
jgi:hypothetical protein